MSGVVTHKSCKNMAWGNVVPGAKSAKDKGQLVQPLAVLGRGGPRDAAGTCTRIARLMRLYGELLAAALPPTLLVQIAVITAWNAGVVLLFQNVVVQSSADVLAEWDKFGAAAKTVLQSCAGLLAFLIVFSSTENYDRWWEARVSWGQMMRGTVELAELASLCIREEELAERIVRHTIAYAYASKQLLREEPLGLEELEGVLTHEDIETIVSQPGWNPAYCLQVCRACVREAEEKEPINGTHAFAIEGAISSLNASIGVSLRLKYTKIPLGHVCYLVSMTWTYLLLLPFALVDEMGWWLLMVSGILTWLMVGIENAGWTMMDPFGFETDDLPLDEYCQKIKLQCCCVFLNVHQQAKRMARPDAARDDVVDFPSQIRNRNTKSYVETDGAMANLRKSFH